MKKQKLIYIAALAGILSASVLSQACNKAGAIDGKEQPKNNPEVFPDLLKRSPKLAALQEWGQVNELTGQLFDRLKKDPNDLDARIKLAEVYMLEARVTGEHGHYYPAALKITQSVLDRNPNANQKFLALSLQTSVYLSLHQFNKALKTGQEALKLNTYNAQIYGALVDAHVELGNYEEAVKMSDKMMSIRPDIRSYSRVSYLREIHGQQQGAIEAMKMAVTAGYPGQEDLAWARLTLGNLYKTYGDLVSAEREYKMILAERPGYPFAIAALGELELTKGNAKEAEKLLKQACEIIPEVGFYESLAQLYQDINRPDEAKKLTTDIVAMMVDDEKAGHVMTLEKANVQMNLLSDYDQALSEAKKEFAKRPGNIDVNKVLAEIYYRKGDYTKASDHLELAQKTNSADPGLQTLAGLISIKTNRQKQGIELLQKSMQTNPFQTGDLASEAKSKVTKG